MGLRQHPHLQGMVISFDIQTFTVKVSYVCVRKSNNNFILSVKELCSFIVEYLISCTADCVNAFTPLLDTSLYLSG
jgi:hypothetical protein